jgi:hypothetical protein
MYDVYDSETLAIPKKLSKRFWKVKEQFGNLSDSTYDIFIDDVITAMENRIKVLRQ